MAYFDNVRPPTARRLPGGYQVGNAAAIARKYPDVTSRLPSGTTEVTTGVGLNRIRGKYGTGMATFAGPSRSIAPRFADETGDRTAEFSGGTGPGGQSILNTAPMAQMPTSAPVPPPQGNAAQRWSSDEDPAKTKRDWMAAGGSEQTYNRSNAAAGRRPGIDARSNPSARNSTASDAIRQQWAEKNAAWKEPEKIY